MKNVFVPLTPEYSLQIPEDVIALIGWIVWFAVLVFVVFRTRDQKLKLDVQSLSWLALLSMLMLVLTSFVGVLLPIGGSVSEGEAPIHHLMFFAAVPWMVAGGILGVFPAVLLAGMSGLLLAYLDTHNIFTPLIFMTYTVIFTWCVRQRYRTLFFRLLRFPLFSAVISFVFTLPAIFFALVLSFSGTMAERFVFAVDRMLFVSATFAGMLVIGGIICVILNVFIPKAWGTDKPLQPAPGETSVIFRLAWTTLPILFILLIVLLISQWTAAETVARRNMVSQITSASELTAEGLSTFVHTGESLILDLGDEIGFSLTSGNDLQSVLAQQAVSFPYFDQLAILESDGTVVANYPSNMEGTQLLVAEAQSVIGNTLTQTGVQISTVAPQVKSQSANLIFTKTIIDANGQASHVVWGQTDLLSNPMAKTFVSVLDDLTHDGGVAQIVGRDRTILYHNDPQHVMGVYSGTNYLTSTYYEEFSADGEGLIQFYQPAGDTGWAAAISIPFSVAETIAWETVLPLFFIGAGTICLVLVIVVANLKPILKDADALKNAANKVSSGVFEVPLEKSRSSGEMAQLTSAFKVMVAFLNNQSKKQADLLSVNERIKSQNDLKSSMDIIMAAALERGVSSVRVVFSDSVKQRLSKTQEHRFGRGKHADVFASLDDQVMMSTKTHGSLVLPDFQMGKILHIAKGTPFPASMMALPLTWKNDWLGVFWVTYQDQKSLPDDLVAFFKVLAGKTSEVVASVMGVDDSKQARAQMESVMDILPDAIIISDASDAVIYYNQAAQTWFDLKNTPTLSKFFTELNMSDQFVPGNLSKWSNEIVIGENLAYLVTGNPILVEGKQAGQAIVIKDITQTKLTDSRKSEIVTTVSHELRSPLTLIHGYAKILQLTGNLNEQQDTYIGNIIAEVEEMRSLVQNLLDLGRLESDHALDLTRIEAGEIVNTAINSMEAQARQKNIQIKVSLPKSPIYFEADETFLAQALKNLIENAIKFSKMGREVTLSVQPNQDSVVFEVKDEGIGISPLDQRHLFKKFQRMSNPVGQNQQGSGLGLAIVKSIAERHGGKAWFDSQLGKGSTFYLQIPVKSINR